MARKQLGPPASAPTDAVAKALLDSSIAAVGAGSEYATLYAAIPTDNTSDAGPAIQALYDAGYSFEGRTGINYVLRTPVFIQRPTGQDGLLTHPKWSTNGVLVIDGAAMPKISDINESTGVWSNTEEKGAVFIGVRRTAWNQGTNRVGIADSGPYSTKSYYRGTSAENNDGTPGAFLIENTTVRGLTSSVEADNDVIVFRSLTGGTIHRNNTLTSFKHFFTFWNYTDLHQFEHIHHESGPGQWYGADGDGAAYYLQTSNGDGVTFNGVKANAHRIAEIADCRGLTINGLVTARLKLIDCDSVNINGAHEETNIWSQASWKFYRSGVTINDSMLYAPDDDYTWNASTNVRYHGSSNEGSISDATFSVSTYTVSVAGTRDLGAGSVVYAVGDIIKHNGTRWVKVPYLASNIEILDSTSNEAGSTVRLNNCTLIRRIGAADQLNGAVIHIPLANKHTRVIFDNVRQAEVANMRPGAVREAPYYAPITSDDAAVTAALATPDALQLIASGTFMLSQIGGTWKVTDLDGVATYKAVQAATPTVDLATGALEVYGMVAGSQTPGANAYYAVAVETSPGRYTASGTDNIVVGASGGVGLEVNCQPGSVVHVWRSTTNAITAPAVYARLGAPSTGNLIFYDLGTTIGGTKWQTYTAGTHLAPPTVSTARVLERTEGSEVLVPITLTLFNEVPNPKPVNASLVSTSLFTATHDTTSLLGANAHKFTRSGAGAGRGGPPVTPLKANTLYTLRFRAYAEAAATLSMSYRPVQASSSTGNVTALAGGASLTTTPQTFTGTFTTSATAGTSNAALTAVTSSLTTGQAFWMSDYTIIEGDYSSAPVGLNGDMTDDATNQYSWEGASNASRTVWAVTEGVPAAVRPAALFPVIYSAGNWTYKGLTITARPADMLAGDQIQFIGNPGGSLPAWAATNDVWTQG